jgi:ribulose-5-phosphate 4-epimerase/fuculose-1-phosphate aldolase
MPYATALSALEGGRLEPIVQPALKFHNQIAYDDAYNGLALDTAEGDRLAHALADKRIAILANHGVITTGPTVAHAFNDLYYLERAAQAQVLAYSTGRPVQRIPKSVCETTFQQMQADRDDQASRFLAEIKRLLDKEEPDYAH